MDEGGRGSEAGERAREVGVVLLGSGQGGGRKGEVGAAGERGLYALCGDRNRLNRTTRSAGLFQGEPKQRAPAGTADSGLMPGRRHTHLSDEISPLPGRLAATCPSLFALSLLSLPLTNTTDMSSRNSECLLPGDHLLH